MKKYLGLILAISAITLATLGGVAWYGEGSAPHPNDTPGKSLQKINSILYSGGIIVTGTFTGSTNVWITNPSVTVSNSAGTNYYTISGQFSTNSSMGTCAPSNSTLGVAYSNEKILNVGSSRPFYLTTVQLEGEQALPIRLLLTKYSLGATWPATNSAATIPLTMLATNDHTWVDAGTSTDWKQTGASLYAFKEKSVNWAVTPVSGQIFVYAVFAGSTATYTTNNPVIGLTGFVN